jgi:hypothetical protein
MGGSVNAVDIFNPDSTAVTTAEDMRQKVVALQDALI